MTIQNPRGRYGLKGISRAGKQAINEGCYLLEYQYKHPNRLGFYTATCPYTEYHLIAEFNRNISEIQRRYFQKCKRAYEKRGCHWHYVSVLEYQEKRWRRDWVAALHIHYVAPCYYDGSRRFILKAQQLREMWRDACTEVIGVACDTSASIDSQVCKKSASGYLSKYMSKGGQIVAEIAETDYTQVPRQWWSMSAFLRKEVKRLTVNIPEPIAEYLYSGGGRDSSELLYLEYRKDIYVCIHGQERRMGMVGRLCRRGMSAMQPPMSLQYSEYRCSVKSCSLYSRRAVDKN